MKYLIWDFDGTLAYRVGNWAAVLLEILRQEVPDCRVKLEDIHPYLKSGFPWHEPSKPNPSNRAADDWWDALMPVLQRAFQGCAHRSADESLRLAKMVRPRYVEQTHWRLYADTLPCLRTLANEGWQHVILSNHVPELPRIIDNLGLSPLIVALFNSAVTGYEKPHPQAFNGMLKGLHQADMLWMIGDNPLADIAGAEAVGIPAILVRTHHPSARTFCRNLDEVTAMLIRHP